MPHGPAAARPASRHRWALLVALLLMCSAAGCGTVDKDDLHSYVQEVHSAAAEGALLADQARRHRLPAEFVWLHAEELRKQVSAVGHHLAGERQADSVKTEAAAAKLLVDEVDGALHLLHREPGDREAAFAARQTLLHQANVADELAEKLK